MRRASAESEFVRSPAGQGLEERAARAMNELDAVLAEAEQLHPAPSGMRWVLVGRGKLSFDLVEDAAPATCPDHPDDPLELGLQGPACTRCERERLEALGCRCGGSSRCPDCDSARAAAQDAEARCAPDCDGLCPVCCPDS